MTELERWMNDHPPLADALTAEETAALRAKVLARRPRVHVLRGWRLAAAAAALCLVAAGAVVLGLFHPMSAANETNALVQKYGEVLDEPLTAEINGHTVSVKALLRDKNTLRVLYPDSHGSMFVWAPVPAGYKTSMEFCLALIDKAGVICTPGSSFGPSGEGYVRFALTMPVEKIGEAVQAIKNSGILG